MCCYNPRVSPCAINIYKQKYFCGLIVGAHPTDSVTSLLKRTGALERYEQSKSTAVAATQAEE
jgi:ribosomal protein S16